MADKRTPDTSEYSASKAPETRVEAEERTGQPTRDWRLIPGGKHGSTAAAGMGALHRSDRPGSAADPVSGDERER